MDENRFFRVLWRINAVLIFGAAAAIAFWAMFFAVVLIAEERIDTPPPPVVESDAEISTSKDELWFQIPYKLKVTGRYTYVEARVGTDSGGKLSSYSESQLRNIAVINLETNESQWVFPDTQQEIDKFWEIETSSRNQKGKLVKTTEGFFLVVATSRADGSVNRDLWVMDPSGVNVKRIKSDVSGQLKFIEFGDNQIRVVIDRNSEIDIFELDIDNLTLGDPVSISMQ